ncbi:MAG TPA: serine hydrolase [Opitutaceae bacterium]|nr:serine hydrolase [Opitutaceae bacterium]HND59917.1 serine hydrolase [Opitutaceae bacterium]
MKSLVVLTLLPLLAAAATGPVTPAQPSLENATALPAVERAAAGLPAGGFVLAEVDGDRVTYASAGHPGPRDGLTPEKILFEIGSITKVFTSLLLAEAVNEGKAKLTDPIGKFLPADVTLKPGTAAITLEQLATHTSGLPALPANFRPANQNDPYADYTVDQLYDFLRAYQPEHPAPQPASYSNVGVGLLGHLLERIYGKPYAELVATRIAGPLGLTDTVIELDSAQADRFAPPHSGSFAMNPWRLPTLAGAGALRSTAADLARFAQALMDPKDPALAAAWTLARQPRAAFGATGHIGLNILIAERNGVTVYNHSGGTGGTRSYLEFVPELHRATVLLVNNDTIEPARIVASVRRPPSLAGKGGAARAEEPIPVKQLTDYVGVYAIDGRGRFTFLLDNTGRLRGRLTAQAFLPVFFAGHDRFFLRVVEAEYQFERDAGGHVTAVVLHQNGREVRATRTEEPVPTVRFLTTDEARDYEGRYGEHPPLQFEVKARGEQVYAKLLGQAAYPVFCDRPDHFAYDIVPAALTFERNAQGEVTAVVLHQNGRDQRAVRLPDPPAKP